MSQYLTNFKSATHIIDDYAAPQDALDNAIVHLAWYGYGDYCGSSLVIFEQGGKLYEVNGSHCSCYGLERQWKPEETSWDAIAKYKISGEYDGSEEANKALQAVVKEQREKALQIKLQVKRPKGRLIREKD